MALNEAQQSSAAQSYESAVLNSTSNFSSKFSLGVVAIAISASTFFSLLLLFALVASKTFTAISSALFFLPLISAAITPVWTISTFLLLLPLFGNRPGTSQCFFLLVAGAGLQIGLVLNLYKRKDIQLKQVLSKQNTIFFMLCCYTAVSVLSLISLPWASLLNELRSQVPSLRDTSALSYFLLSFFSASEEKIAYSILSVVWTLLSVSLGSFAFLQIVKDKRAALKFASALLVGLIITLSAGILDYYSIINLKEFRGLDPIVNPEGVQFRMQSFFGHSGWFAEYVTLSIPLVMVFLLLPLRFRTRIAVILTTLLVGEFCLILSFQRGGWVSYPLTLFVIWAAIYVSYKIELGETDFLKALRASMVKVLVSIPLTLLASILLLVALDKTGLVESNSENLISKYVNRFSDIKKTSDRTDFFRAGLLLGMVHPFLGGGSESFSYRFNEEFNLPSGHYYQELNLPLHGTSHNVFMQTFSGKGIAGLLFLILMIGSLITVSIKEVMYGASPFPNKIFLLITASLGAAFLIYGNVQELFYIQPLQYLIFFSLFLAVSQLKFNEHVLRFRTCNFLLTAIAALTISHVAWNYFNRGAFSSNSAYGCFSPETDPSGSSYSWCGVRASQPFLIASEGSEKVVHVNIEAANPAKKEAHNILIRTKGFDFGTFDLQPGQRQSIKVVLPQNSQSLVYTNGSSQYIDLDLFTGNYFIPARDWINTSDKRILSYKLYSNS